MRMETDRQGLAVGSRFESNGQYGTIRYIGEIPTTQGEWLGVEWDDPKRGKHDGVHEGTRYFTTSHPTAGSFIRPKKANFGVLFLQALHERYGLIEDDSAGVLEEEMFVKGTRNQVTTVEVVGAHSVNLKQSQFSSLKQVSLRGEMIRGADADGAITTVSPNILELDISKNLLDSWTQVADIARQLPKLASLNVSENHLSLVEDNNEMSEAFSSLITLFIVRMNYSWEQVMKLSVLFPKLANIHICFNQISVLTDPLPSMINIKLLNLEGNSVNEWEEILKLGHIPNLQILILNDNSLEKIYFPDSPLNGTTSLFSQLQELTLNHNKISEWVSVNELNKLPKLEHLKIQFNPITTPSTSTSKETIFYEFIARVKQIKLYNRMKVDKEDRQGAEIDYLKTFGSDWKKAGGHQDPTKNQPSSEFTQLHPRYQELINIWGAPEDSEMVKITTALKGNLINVTIDCDQRPEKPPKKIKLPEKMTVQKLKAMLLRAYKGDPLTIYLTYTSPQMPNREIPFDNDLREIGYFAVEEGDVIHVRW